MSAYYPDITREGLSITQYDLIVNLLDTYTYDAPLLISKCIWVMEYKKQKECLNNILKE